MHGRMCCPHQEISEVQATFNGACKLTVDNTGPEFGFSGLSFARRPNSSETAQVYVGKNASERSLSRGTLPRGNRALY